MEKVNHFRTSCWFCGHRWGMCRCTWLRYDEFVLPDDADGFVFEDMFISQPNVTENTIDFVDSPRYYGEAFTKWWAHHPKNVSPCDDHCELGQAECRHGLQREIP